MIKTSKRINNTKAYYFAEKLAEVNQLCEQGRPVINLAIGNPDLTPDQTVIDALINSTNKENVHQYQSYRGSNDLRMAFKHWYQKQFKVTLDYRHEILPLTGSKEAVMYLSMAFLDPGDEVLVPDPGYPIYASAAELSGASVITYNLLEENNWKPDLEELHKLISERTKMLWINFPGNPTGASADIKDLSALVRFARKHGILLCADNPYCFILNDQPLSIFNIPGAKDVAVELNSLSKSHNMPGWRIGMLAGNSIFIDAVAKVKSNIDTGMFKPIQEASAVALTLKEEWYSNLNIIYRERQQEMFHILDVLGCSYQKDSSGLYVWAAIPIHYGDSFAFCDYLLETFNVFVAPGAIYGKNGERFIRTSLTQPVEVLREVLKRILQYKAGNTKQKAGKKILLKTKR